MTFEEVYKKFGPMIRARCRYLLKNAEDSEDLFQEICLLLQRKLKDFLACESQVGWIYRVTTNLALNAIRSRARRLKRGMPTEDLSDVQDPIDFETQIQSRIQSRAIILKIPDTLQPLFVHYYWDGMTQEEAAVVLRCSRITVARQLAKLKILLREEENSPNTSDGSQTNAEA
ncbi:MAG: RNA polymerase sigma factor [Bdellovibrionota bacterium]